MGHNSKTQKTLVVLGLLLGFAGFGIFLGGLAAMQDECGVLGVEQYAIFNGIGYLAPMGCNMLFRYTWWILFFHFFVWCLVLAFLFMGLHKLRAGLIGLLAAAAVLLMDSANTYLAFDDVRTVDGNNADTFIDRAVVTFVGAMICAIADLLLILFIGWHGHEHDYHRDVVKTEEKQYGYAGGTSCPPGTTPVATNVESTTAATTV